MSILKTTQWIRKQKPCPGTFGLEIETETMERYDLEAGRNLGKYNFPEPNTLKDWVIVEDHSLRNFGYEYILTKPLSFEDVKAALDEFDKKTNKRGIKFLQDRHSTSNHVHINFQQETFKTLGNFCTLFVLFEEVLVSFCGEGRKSNFFCMTTKYAEGLTDKFVSFFEMIYKASPKAFTTLNEELSKYSSLNIVPLYKQGSVEVRTMRGSTDVATIYKWVGMLNALLKFARQDMTPIDIINCWRQEGMLLFCEIFEEYLVELGKGDDVEKLIERNLWSASSIACSVPDWNKIDQKMHDAQVKYDEKVKAGDDGIAMKVKQWGDPIANIEPFVIDDEED